MRKIFLLPLLFNLFCFAQSIDNSQLNTFLKKHISEEGIVDYEKVIKNEAEINTIMSGLSKITPNGSWSKNEAKAYWINLYNISILKLVSKYYPLKSINYIDEPFKKEFISVNGELISLNGIINDYLKDFKDPRVYFAIHTSANSSPKIKKTAYSAQYLDKELDLCTAEYVNDTGKNFFSKTEDQVSLSGLFEQIAPEFSKKDDLISFVNKYSTNKPITQNTQISYLTFDWTLLR